jgi:hypothetical protein
LVDNDPRGQASNPRLRRAIDLLREVGILDGSVTVDDAATLEFIPPI